MSLGQDGKYFPDISSDGGVWRCVQSQHHLLQVCFSSFIFLQLKEAKENKEEEEVGELEKEVEEVFDLNERKKNKSLHYKRSFFVRMVSDPKIYNPKIVHSLPGTLCCVSRSCSAVLCYVTSCAVLFYLRCYFIMPSLCSSQQPAAPDVGVIRRRQYLHQFANHVSKPFITPSL